MSNFTELEHKAISVIDKLREDYSKISTQKELEIVLNLEDMNSLLMATFEIGAHTIKEARIINGNFYFKLG